LHKPKAGNRLFSTSFHNLLILLFCCVSMEIPFTCRSEFGSILWIPILVMTSSMILCGLFLEEFFKITFIVFGICIFALVMSWLIISYRFNDNELIVKVPLQTVNIKYGSVTKITVPGMNDYIQGSSMRTIGIHYEKKSYVSISPVKREEIIELLRRKCFNAIFEDSRSDPLEKDTKTV